jgi:hypothetical protein
MHGETNIKFMTIIVNLQNNFKVKLPKSEYNKKMAQLRGQPKTFVITVMKACGSITGG